MIRSQIATNVENISGVKDQRSLVNSCISIALDRVFRHYDWPYYIQEKALETVNDYTTGLVTVTNGSKTVSGNASTVWDTSWVGRKFRVSGEGAYYKISSVTAVNSLTLEENYQGDSQTDVAYEIFKDEYRLSPDVHKIKIMRQIENSKAMSQDIISEFDRVLSTPDDYSDPIRFMIIGTKLDVYSTGTVSATGSTITGTGTLWTSVEGLGRCSKIRIGSNVYTIKSVDSATQITTYESVGTVAGNTSYEITLDNIRIQVYPIPDAQRLLYYRYFRKPAILANDYDIPDMPERWHELLIWGTLSEILSHKGDVNKAENVYEARFNNGLIQMQLKIGSFSPDMRHIRKSIDKVRRVPRGLESSDYDIRFSV